MALAIDLLNLVKIQLIKIKLKQLLKFCVKL
nr:MAG TPA: hypothetical protein [Crassvirales sp.]